MPIRTVKSIEDVNNSLREIYDFMDRWDTKTIDLGGRRVKNAGMSKDPFDYVVRRELERFEGAAEPAKQKKQAVPSSIANYDKVTFGIAVQADLEVGDDLTPPFIWTNERESKPPTLIALACNIIPSGQDAVIDIRLKRPNSIWSAGATIFKGAASASQTEGYLDSPTSFNVYGFPFLPKDSDGGVPKTAYVSFNPAGSNSIFQPSSILTGFKRFDIISVHCLQAGNPIAGRDIEIVLYCPLK